MATRRLTKKTYTQLMGRLFGTPLLIERHKLEAILVALGPRLQLDVHELEVAAAAVPEEEQDHKPYHVTDDGVAVINIMGSLVHRSSFADALSGLTSYSALALELGQALADQDVKGVVLLVDSPGGEVAGVFDLADMIFKARSTKPVVAVAEDLAASAAYLLGSAASGFYVTQSGVLGSIGVVLAHADTSEQDRLLGVKITEVHAGARKVDLSEHRSLSPEAHAALQRHVNAYYDMFVTAVGRHRRRDPEIFRQTQAGLYVGQAAVEAGLADGVLTARQVTDWAGLIQEHRDHHSRDGRRSAYGGLLPLAPFGGYQDFADCVSKNQDKDNPQAYCGFIKHQTEGAATTVVVGQLDNDGKALTATLEETKMTKDEQDRLEAALAENGNLKAALAKAEAQRDAHAAALAAVEGARKLEVIKRFQVEGRVAPAMLASVIKLADTCTVEELEAQLRGWPRVVSSAPEGSPAGEGVSERPETKLKLVADNIRKAMPQLSVEQAAVKAMEQNPELYAAHRKQRRVVVDVDESSNSADA